MRLLLLVLALSQTALAKENTLALTLDAGEFGPAEPIQLYFEKRLTFVMPTAVSAAVPGSPDVVKADVRDNVVVVTLVDSQFVRKRRPETNLTILARDGVPFTCRLQVADKASDATYDLVRVKRGEGHQVAVSADAARLVEAWLLHGADGVAPQHAAALERLDPLLARRARRSIARWVAQGGFEAEPDVRRTKREFIYLTSRGVVRLGDVAVLHLALVNHSQAPFTVGGVTLEVDGAAVPTEALEVKVAAPVVPPDGTPRGVALVLDHARVADAALRVQVCDDQEQPRCVRVAVR